MEPKKITYGIVHRRKMLLWGDGPAAMIMSFQSPKQHQHQFCRGLFHGLCVQDEKSIFNRNSWRWRRIVTFNWQFK
jgi:hypothetical protein